MSVREWRDKNQTSKGNIRDEADVNQLVCLANLESLNAHFINEGLSQNERLQKLNNLAITQMKILSGNNQKRLELILGSYEDNQQHY